MELPLARKNSIRQLQFRHGGTADVQGIGWLQHRQGGGIGIHQLPCGGKAGLEVCAGGIKVLLGGNAANHGAVYFHLQGKVQVQPMGNHSPKYHPGGAGASHGTSCRSGCGPASAVQNACPSSNTGASSSQIR